MSEEEATQRRLIAELLTKFEALEDQMEGMTHGRVPIMGYAGAVLRRSENADVAFRRREILAREVGEVFLKTLDEARTEEERAEILSIAQAIGRRVNARIECDALVDRDMEESVLTELERFHPSPCLARDRKLAALHRDSMRYPELLRSLRENYMATYEKWERGDHLQADALTKGEPDV